MPPYDPAITVRWFPIQAKFAPDGTWLVVNFCNYYNPHYCRLVRWEPGTEPVAGTERGRWRLIAGQEPGKSYLWPSVSWDGKKLTFTVADCDAERPKDWPPSDGKPGTPEAPPTRCAIFAARPAVSGSVDDIRNGYREIAIPTVARPTWRPDDKAIIYWRTKGQATLASGRVAGSRSIYEFDLEIGREEAKLDSAVDKLSWTNEFSAARYMPDGRRFLACGYTLSSEADKYLDSGIPCFQANAQHLYPVSVLNARRESKFSSFYAIWRESHLLIKAENKLFLVDQKDRKRGVPVFEAPTMIGTIVDADIAEPSGDVVAIQETLFRQMEPFRSGGKGHYNEDSHIKPPRRPLLIFFRRSAGTPAPVIWPNLESIDSNS